MPAKRVPTKGTFHDLTGHTYGKWRIIERAPNKFSPSGQSQTAWLCESAETGERKERRAASILRPSRGKSRIDLSEVERGPLAERFMQYVDAECRPEPTTCKGFGPCLIWTGGTDSNGRASMTVNGLSKRASHVAWFLAHGCWPAFLCHRCDNRRCVNSDHLFEGDSSSNQYDRRQKERGGIQVP